MFHALRTVSQRAVATRASASMYRAAAAMPAARAFTVAPARSMASHAASSRPAAAAASSTEAVAGTRVEPYTAAERAEFDMPDDMKVRVDSEGVRWVDYRPEHLRSITAVRNADGDLVGQFEGEEVIFPDLEPTLEWCLSTPVEAHLFEEAPIIKMYESESDEH